MGWVRYGGKYLPGEVISINVRNKAAFIKFFTDSGIEKKKQLVMLNDIVDFGNTLFNKVVIGSDESVRNKFITASIYIEERK